MVSDHFRFGILAQSFRRDALSRHFLQVPESKVLSDAPKKNLMVNADQRAQWFREKLDIVTFNAAMTNPDETIPVPRFVVEKNKRRSSARRKSARSIKSRLSSLIAPGSMFYEDPWLADVYVAGNPEMKPLNARGEPYTEFEESILSMKMSKK